MPPVNKIRKLPPDVLAEVNKALADGMSVEQVQRLLAGLGHKVSTAGVGRYRKWWAHHVEPTLAYRAFVDAVADGLTSNPENRAGVRYLEMIQAQLAEALTELKGDDMPLKKRMELLAAAAVAQAKLSTARREEIHGMVKLADYREAMAAREGDILQKQGGKLVRVEFVDAPAPTMRAIPPTDADADAQAQTPPEKTPRGEQP